jgi:exportin-2 (importin alpha re-exporter)
LIKMIWEFIFQDAEVAGVLEQLRSKICDNLRFHVVYDKKFEPYMPQFVTAVMELLVKTGLETKYDAVSK